MVGTNPAAAFRGFLSFPPFCAEVVCRDQEGLQWTAWWLASAWDLQHLSMLALLQMQHCQDPSMLALRATHSLAAAAAGHH